MPPRRKLTREDIMKAHALYMELVPIKEIATRLSLSPTALKRLAEDGDSVLGLPPWRDQRTAQMRSGLLLQDEEQRKHIHSHFKGMMAALMKSLGRYLEKLDQDKDRVVSPNDLATISREVTGLHRLLVDIQRGPSPSVAVQVNTGVAIQAGPMITDAHIKAMQAASEDEMDALDQIQWRRTIELERTEKEQAVKQLPSTPEDG